MLRAVAEEEAHMPYARRFGCLRNPAVSREIASLDAERDCQRIVHLLSAYEFAWDLKRAGELALFYSYASKSVARLLDRTGEFERRGQLRYDDTQLLIGSFVESGWDSDFGRRAIERMNAIHGRFRIPHADFVFVLWTLIHVPLRWVEEFAHRPFTAHEARAWFWFWRGVGERMGMQGLPETKHELDRFIADYAREQLVYNEASRRVANATVRILENWLPRRLRFVVQPAAASLLEPRAREAFGYAEPHAAVGVAVRGVLKLRARVSRYVPLSQYPSRISELKTRSYGRPGVPLEELGARTEAQAASWAQH
jgi:hypothetical protein